MTEGSGELWGGRFSRAPAPEAQALGRSLEVDTQLVSEDVRAGIAHVGALRDAGLPDGRRRAAPDGGARTGPRRDPRGNVRVRSRRRGHPLGRRARRHRSARRPRREAPRRAIEERPRRDRRQAPPPRRPATVSTDVRALGRVLVERAREHAADPMPGSTHVRPAQPITLGHHLCAHAWALARDLERFAGWRRRASVSPLGAGALATSTLGLDPVATAERLGFDRAFDNSLDAVSDRDVLQECVAVAAICATHLSRLAADLLRWTDPALGWAELDDAYSTGSSMMPQKRNPDTAELARGQGRPDHGRLRDARRDAPGVAARLPARPPRGQRARVRRDGHAPGGRPGAARRGRDAPDRHGGDAGGVRATPASTRPMSRKHS